MKFPTANVLSLSILLITISSITQWSSLPLGNTVIWWLLYAFILLLFIKAKKWSYDTENNKDIVIIKVYLVWNLICIVRGMVVAEDYWDWKNLVGNTMVLLLPLSIFITTEKYMVQKITRTWLLYAIPGFLLFLPFLFSDGVGRYLMPISFLLLFFPVVPKKWKALLFVLALFVITYDLTARSNVIKFMLPFIFCLAYYIPKFLRFRIIKLINWVFLLLPFFLFTLGIFQIFNVFKMDEYIGDIVATERNRNGDKDASLTTDTRTLVYSEILSSSFKNDHIWLGRTPAKGYESEWFYNFSLFTEGTGQVERSSSEVSILNIYMWTGIVGVLLYFIMFYRATYLAIFKSNNIFIKIIALAVAFRWMYAWVEDFSYFDLSYLYLWIMIGLCYSKSFREMDDFEFRHWVLGIFDRKYYLHKENIGIN